MIVEWFFGYGYLFLDEPKSQICSSNTIYTSNVGGFNHIIGSKVLLMGICPSRMWLHQPQGWSYRDHGKTRLNSCPSSTVPPVAPLANILTCTDPVVRIYQLGELIQNTWILDAAYQPLKVSIKFMFLGCSWMFYISRLRSQDLSPCSATRQLFASETCNINFGHLAYGVDGVDGVVGLISVGYDKRQMEKQTFHHQRQASNPVGLTSDMHQFEEL